MMLEPLVSGTRRAAVVLVLLLLSLPAAAQAPSGEEWQALDAFGEEIAVEVVNLDVWVTDRQGRAVTGLGQDAFELLVDGKPAAISNFAAYEGAPPPLPARGADWASLPAAGGDDGSIPDEDRLHLTVFLDHWNLRPEDRGRVFDDLRGFLEHQLAPGDRVAVALHDRGLELVQSFTPDRAELTRTLDRLERIAPSGIQVATERRGAIDAVRTAYEGAGRSMVGIGRANRGRGQAQDTVPEDDGSPSGGAAAGDDVCELAWGEMQNAAIGYAASVQAQVQQSASGLASMAQILSGVPGRRILLYVGNGLAQTAGLEIFQFVGEVCPHFQSELAFYHATYDMSWLYQEVADRANAARVTFYTIEAASTAIDLGIDAGSPGGVSAQAGTLQPDAGMAERIGAANAPRLVPSTHVQRTADLDREGPLVLLAQQTGGRAILNAGDFAEDFTRIAGDLRTYYSLGFSPPSASDGRRHRLEVRLKGGEGYRARHREAYRSKAPGEQMAERVLGVAQFGLGGNPLAARIEPGAAVARGDGVYRVPVRIFVPLERLTLVAAAAGGRQGRLRVLMSATDAQGQLGPVRQKVVPVDVEAAAAGAVGGKLHLVEVEVDLAAGLHTVALGVRDDLGGETSYLSAELRVPGGPAGGGGR